VKCPFCKNIGSKVVDSRLIEKGDGIRRRRECLSCKKRFTTYERYDGLPLMVIKKDKRREPFDRIKVTNGILRACNKRKISRPTIDNIVEEVEKEIGNHSGSEIKSSEIGKQIAEKLKQLDEVAYVRFASVFKGFSDASSFIKEVKELEGS